MTKETTGKKSSPQKPAKKIDLESFKQLKKHDKRIAQDLKIPKTVQLFIFLPIVLLIILILFGVLYLAKLNPAASYPSLSEDRTTQ